jgi:hypothetical protein
VTRARALVITGFLGLAIVPAARTYAPQVALVSPFTSPRATPPFRTSAPGVETRFFGRLVSTQAVIVTIDGSGDATRVVDVDRILVSRKGDYSFAINGPIDDVRAAPGSESEPGLRTSSVVWQGFSPGRRMLAAEITLRTEALQVARALDAARAALVAGVPVSAPVVRAFEPPRNVRIQAFTPLRVTGVAGLRTGGSSRISTAVGAKPVRVELPAAPRSLDLAVTVAAPATLLNAPGAGRWADLARSGRLHDGRALTRTANERLLAAALAGQFHEFVENPDPSGSTRTSYRYVLPDSTPAATIRTEGGGSPWLAISVAVAAAIGLLGGIVLWAHS